MKNVGAHLLCLIRDFFAFFFFPLSMSYGPWVVVKCSASGIVRLLMVLTLKVVAADFDGGSGGGGGGGGDRGEMKQPQFSWVFCACVLTLLFFLNSRRTKYAYFP